MKIVLDTNVLIAALRSSLGASHALLQLVYRRKVFPLLSVPLFLEFEAVAKRPGLLPHLESGEIDVDSQPLCRTRYRAKDLFLLAAVSSRP